MGPLLKMPAVVVALGVVVGSGCQPSWPEGVQAPEPVQEDVVGDRAMPVALKGGTATPRAEYRIEGLVLSRMAYRSDQHASLSPLDLAIGWGPMADAALLRKLRVRQNDRYFFWSSSGPLPVARPEIEHHAANVHLVWGSKQAEKVAGGADPGDVVRLTGRLVDLAFGDGHSMATSLRRDDVGGGACEVLLVEEAVVLR